MVNIHRSILQMWTFFNTVSTQITAVPHLLSVLSKPRWWILQRNRPICSGHCMKQRQNASTHFFILTSHDNHSTTESQFPNVSYANCVSIKLMNPKSKHCRSALFPNNSALRYCYSFSTTPKIASAFATGSLALCQHWCFKQFLSGNEPFHQLQKSSILHGARVSQSMWSWTGGPRIGHRPSTNRLEIPCPQKAIPPESPV